MLFRSAYMLAEVAVTVSMFIIGRRYIPIQFFKKEHLHYVLGSVVIDGRQQGDDFVVLRFDGMPQCMGGILAAAPVKNSLRTFHTAKLVDRRRFRVSFRDKSECVIMIVMIK